MIRMGRVVLRNFKNTEYGSIAFPTFSKTISEGLQGPDIVGIYGQNGSGKTSVIDAMGVLKCLMAGEALPSRVFDFLPCDGKSFGIELEFLLNQSKGRVLPGGGVDCGDNETSEGPWLLSYEVEVARDEGVGFYVAAERLKAKDSSSSRAATVILDVRVERRGRDFIRLDCSPSGNWGALFSGRKRDQSEFDLALHLANERNMSMVFSKSVFSRIESLYNSMADDMELLSKRSESAFHRILEPYIFLVPEIAYNAIDNMVVLSTSSHAEVVLNYLHIRSNSAMLGGGSHSDLRMNLLAPSVLKESRVASFKGVIAGINMVLDSFLPGFSLLVNDLGRETMEDGATGVRVEVLSKRGEAVIPLRCESEGVKKLVSITNLLVGVYNNPSAFLAVDELDSGVFEYLLGQIIETMSQYARGQLLFTAHNLYPLEKLNAKSVVFSTANPSNRFITMTGIKTNHNLRDVYLRDLELGGQKEPMYRGTNRYEIDNAFYEAGQAMAELDG